MKILIIQTAFIGDVVLATSLIESIKQAHPDSEIDFLLRKGNEAILHNNNKVNKVFIFNKKSRKTSELIRIIRQVRQQRYQYVINAQRFLTTGIITVLSKGKVTIGFDKNPLSFAFTKRIKHTIDTSNYRHEVARNHALISSITNTTYKRPRMYVSEKDMKVVPRHEPYICIAPSSVWFTKQWPIDKWCELIAALPNKYKVYLLGSADDRAICETIKNQTSNISVEVLAGRLSITQSAAFIQGARLTVANDSAPLHFASAVNAPVAAIFCSTVPQFGFGPLSDQSYIFETSEKLSCRPCGLHGKKECPEGHFRCANSIDITNIIQKTGL